MKTRLGKINNIFKESFERELYVNQRQLSDEIETHNNHKINMAVAEQRRLRKHRYHYIDGDVDRSGSVSPIDPLLSEVGLLCMPYKDAKILNYVLR